MNRPARGDQIFYGRYNELFFGPMLLLGLALVWLRCEVNWRDYAVCGGALAAMALVVTLLYGDTASLHYLIPNTAALFFFFTAADLQMHYWPAVAAALLAGLGAVAARARAVALKAVCLVLVCAYFLAAGYGVLFSTSIQSGRQKAALMDMAERIRTEDLPCYFAAPEDIVIYYSAMLQYLMKDETLRRSAVEDLPLDGEPYLAVCDARSILLLPGACEPLLSADGLILMRCTGVPDDNDSVDIPLDFFYTTTGEKTPDAVVATGREGYLLYGPYATVPPGEMAWTVDLRLAAAPPPAQGEALGRVELTAIGEDGQITALAERTLFAADFAPAGGADGRPPQARLTLAAAADTPLENVECRVVLVQGAYVDVTGVTYARR